MGTSAARSARSTRPEAIDRRPSGSLTPTSCLLLCPSLSLPGVSVLSSAPFLATISREPLVSVALDHFRCRYPSVIEVHIAYLP